MDSCCTFQTEFFRSFSFEKKIRKVYIHDNELIVIFDMDADEQTIEQIIQEEKQNIETKQVKTENKMTQTMKNNENENEVKKEFNDKMILI